MIESRRVRSRCDKCEKSNDIALGHFLTYNYKFSQHIIATCTSCRKDYVASWHEKMVL